MRYNVDSYVLSDTDAEPRQDVTAYPIIGVIRIVDIGFAW